ncbi:MAG: hypothetical protein D6766_03670 [Verrucomicrobia bacterium]|nr:MAG: hypothetical protein D6766_03670 [Verrucomicrobiota bacterium]
MRTTGTPKRHRPEHPTGRLVALATGLAVLAALPLQASDWPNWRGPFFNGSTDETGLPATWSKTDHVIWSTALPGPSAATPIISGRHLFISSTDEEADTLLAMAFDRDTGRELWRHVIARGTSRDRLSNFASPSPVTDGQRVVFLYGNGLTVAFDFAGHKLWERDLCKDYGEFAFNWTYGASPLLHDGQLIYQVLQRNEPVHGRGLPNAESYLLAVDPATGKTLWRHVRPSDAVAESREAYSTPIPFEGAGRKEILVVGGDCLTGHAAEDGHELWRWGTWNPRRIGHWRLVPSPVTGGGVILACAPKGGPIFAIKAGANGRIPQDGYAWSTEADPDVTTDVPTPLFYQGDFFVLGDRARSKTLARVDPATGKVRWKVEAPGRAKYEASPTGADGRIFCLNFKGEVAVFDAATGKLLQVIPMGEPGDDRTRSTIAVAHGRLFIRTNHRLYCIGNR